MIQRVGDWGWTLLGVSPAGFSWAPELVYVGPVTDLPCGSASGSWLGEGAPGPHVCHHPAA